MILGLLERRGWLMVFMFELLIWQYVFKVLCCFGSRFGVGKNEPAIIFFVVCGVVSTFCE